MQTNPFGDNKPFNVLATKIRAEIKRMSRSSIRVDLSIKEKIDKKIPEMLVHYLLMKSGQSQFNDVVGRMERFFIEKGIDTKLFLHCVEKEYRGPLSVDDLIKDIFREKPKA